MTAGRSLERGFVTLTGGVIAIHAAETVGALGLGYLGRLLFHRTLG
ncbi:hypothetical protein [Brevundimonas variabilis]|uniref:Uncharacterized protein n=1 Tax=Brevundimonas variabilis TaxID=74312 RepID=A0A7W9CG49_9CAUL|nr:hypothetical protein [Brevundimonas variabilis]MBB5744871.1 hypothetical protein [Brevundimonas variabilis]